MGRDHITQEETLTTPIECEEKTTEPRPEPTAEQPAAETQSDAPQEGCCEKKCDAPAEPTEGAPA
jgi:hypothetical protein